MIVFELKISLAHVFSLEFSRIKKKLIPNICIVLGFLPYLSKTTTCPCKCQYGGSWALAQLNCSRQRRRNIDNWGGGADIHIFVFCPINFFWNRLFLQSVNTNIWISAPAIINIPAPLVRDISFQLYLSKMPSDDLQTEYLYRMTSHAMHLQNDFTCHYTECLHIRSNYNCMYSSSTPPMQSNGPKSKVHSEIVYIHKLLTIGLTGHEINLLTCGLITIS